MALVAALSRCLFVLIIVGADESATKFTSSEMEEINLILDRGAANDARNLSAIEQLFSHMLVEELSDPVIRKDIVPIEHHQAIVKKMERLGRMLRESFEYNEKEGEKGEEYMRYFKEQGERRFTDKRTNGGASFHRPTSTAISFILPLVLIRVAATDFS